MVIIIGSPKPVIVSRASETHCGPAKIDFRWPDWPAREKVKYDPWGPRNSTELLKINTTKFQVEREPVYVMSIIVDVIWLLVYNKSEVK